MAKTLEQNAAALKASVQKLLGVKDGTLKNTTKDALDAALRSLEAGSTGIQVSAAACNQAVAAIATYVSDQVPAKKGVASGGAVGEKTPAYKGASIPAKSVFGNDDAAGTRSRIPLSVIRASRDLQLLQLRG